MIVENQGKGGGGAAAGGEYLFLLESKFACWPICFQLYTSNGGLFARLGSAAGTMEIISVH